MTSTQQQPEPADDRAARQKRAESAVGARLEVHGDPETLAQRVATAGRVNGGRA